MLKKINVKKFIIILSTIVISIFLLISFIIGNEKFSDIKSIITADQKRLIIKIFFPYKLISKQKLQISEQTDKIEQLKNFRFKAELYHKEILSDISTKESITTLKNNLIMKKYLLTSGFYAGIHDFLPGSGYIDFHDGKIVVLSSRGILAFKNDLEDNNENFKQIKNNINEFIGLDQFIKDYRYSLKDIFIFNKKIFISLTEEIEENCWNTSIIYGEMNYENIMFQKLFTPKECIHSINNIDKEFSAHQTGGRIVSFDDNHILFTIGEYRSRFLAQDKKSINGKIIKINIYNSNYEIISMGHRNPQGLYFDKEHDFILSTEHGPRGGDEINLIEVSKINGGKVQNYGWPISSAGEHYLHGGPIGSNQEKYDKYPLYNSHSKHGFIEPLYSFVPSIAISEIVKITQDRYVVSSMKKDRALYFFELNEQKQIINLNKVEVFERVRDLIFNNNKLYIFMETTPSIGVINFN
tara:strand:+ start:141 stop:1544 length:1404 start_codon:yes stop_codon:yes gene_type:complete